jgi:hypothetical protein
MNLAIDILLHAGRSAVDVALYTLLPRCVQANQLYWMDDVTIEAGGVRVTEAIQVILCRRNAHLDSPSAGDTGTSRNTAGLQFGDDLVGDFGVKARAVVTGTDSCCVAGHRGSPRRALIYPCDYHYIAGAIIQSGKLAYHSSMTFPACRYAPGRRHE